MSQAPVRVVIAAGGLGTRVAGWAQLVPKEFQPVDGQPALLHLLHELISAGTQDAVLVYHRYYEPFIAWTRQALRPGATASYRALAGLPHAAAPRHESLRMRFVRQRGAYADITSVLNGAAHLPAGPLFVAFADNLYPHENALALLQNVPEPDAAVLARPFDRNQAPQRGVIVTTGTGQRENMVGMLEKPNGNQVDRLITQHGAARLRLLEGRFRIPADLLAQLHATARHPRSAEPRLSLKLAAYAQTRPVHVLTTQSAVIDLGQPAARRDDSPPGRPAVDRTAPSGRLQAAR